MEVGFVNAEEAEKKQGAGWLLDRVEVTRIDGEGRHFPKAVVFPCHSDGSGRARAARGAARACRPGSQRCQKLAGDRGHRWMKRSGGYRRASQSGRVVPDKGVLKRETGWPVWAEDVLMRWSGCGGGTGTFMTKFRGGVSILSRVVVRGSKVKGGVRICGKRGVGVKS
eukprot:142010-Hanusia_phi.AAC.2